MRSSTAAPIVVTIAVVLATACGDAVGPDDLTVDLDLVPDHVVPGDSLTARATITNPTSETIRVTSESCGGPWRHRAYRAGEPIDLDGLIGPSDPIICLAVAVAPIELEPGASLPFEWTIHASVDGEPAPSGEYRLRFESVVEDLDGAEETFTVGEAFPAR